MHTALFHGGLQSACTSTTSLGINSTVERVFRRGEIRLANIFMVLWACCTCVVEVADLPSRAASVESRPTGEFYIFCGTCRTLHLR